MPDQPFLNSPVQSLPGIGPKRAMLLGNLGIETVRDLLLHFPRAYQDRRTATPIREVREGEMATIEAEVVRSRVVRLRSRLSLAEVVLRDATGELRAIWFGRPFLAKGFSAGARGFFSGLAGKWNGLALRNPDYEMLSGDDEDRLHTGRIVPLYPLTEQVSHRMLRTWIWTALDALDTPIEDPIPPTLREKHGFPPPTEALRTVHFPEDLDAARKARNRFAYAELLGIQIAVLQSRARRHLEASGCVHIVDGPLLARFRSSLPFELTAGQQQAVRDMLEDMASPRPMARLLQGDVGSGKTVVALHAVAAAADGGYQTAFMAPTEVLAEQHGLSLRGLLAPTGIEVVVLTGTSEGASAVRDRIASGAVAVVVGTHALIQESTRFHRLGLAIIDEQHRFGVMQRSALVEKGLNPDLLHMSATPIPRTLAITVYGGMDISVIEDMPPGRKPVKTLRVTPAKLAEVYDAIREHAAQGLQTYVICPLVEESAKRELTAVTRHYEQMSAGVFAGLRTGLIHGRVTSREKDAVMDAFRRGAIDVLFATTVIEVGVDCPNATTILIEDAPQFGLTQLHQLRGRVGRGPTQSFCYLAGKPATPDGRERVRIMCDTANGFEIAEADLALRGPGEFCGVRQAGLSDLRFADLIRDSRLLDAARRDAQDILARDPELSDPEHAILVRNSGRFDRLQS